MRLAPIEECIPVGDLKKLGNFRHLSRPTITCHRRGVDDGSALGNTIDESVGESARRCDVYRHAGANSSICRDACVGEQHVDRTFDLGDCSIDRRGISEVRFNERVAAASWSLDVENGEVFDTEFVEKFGQCGANTSRSSREDNSLAGITEQVCHGIEPPR